jgi:DDE family transposase
MKIDDLKNKIPEVKAYACVVAQQYGHTKKFAKHLVGFVIQQIEGLKDYELADFVVKDPIGKLLGYGERLHKSTISKVRSRSDPNMFAELYNWIVSEKFRNVPIQLFVGDSTAIPSGSVNDKDAKVGYRTPSKIEQKALKSDEKTFVFGYKVHMIADVDSEIPLCISVEPANKNDVKPFPRLYDRLKSNFRLKLGAKFLADSQYSSAKIRYGLRYDGYMPVVPVRGNKYSKTRHPKDPDYGRRWAIEHIFSRLKDVFGLGKSRTVGLKKTIIHVYSCLLGYIMRYLL